MFAIWDKVNELFVGFGALAALKRKRKKFSKSRNTSPVLESSTPSKSVPASSKKVNRHVTGLRLHQNIISIYALFVSDVEKGIQCSDAHRLWRESTRRWTARRFEKSRDNTARRYHSINDRRKCSRYSDIARSTIASDQFTLRIWFTWSDTTFAEYHTSSWSCQLSGMALIPLCSLRFAHIHTIAHSWIYNNFYSPNEPKKKYSLRFDEQRIGNTNRINNRR